MTLHRRPLGRQLASQALVEDPFVRHVLIEKIEPVGPFEQDERSLVLS